MPELPLRHAPLRAQAARHAICGATTREEPDDMMGGMMLLGTLISILVVVVLVLLAVWLFQRVRRGPAGS